MKLFIIMLIGLSSTLVNAQNVKQIHIDSVRHFQGVRGAGKTSKNQFYDAISDSGVVPLTKIRLRTSSVDTLNKLLNSVIAKKHKPIKANGCIFAIANYSGRYTMLAIFDWGIVTIFDQKEYVFKGTLYNGMFRQFVASNF